jgi:DNA invertase Pin-like site-specific DNA recombinase
MLRAALYVRVSTEEQDTNTQLAQVREIAPPDVVVFTEHQSAFKDSLKVRPIFSDLKARIIKGEFKALYVWDFDRLFRNRVQAIAFMELCQHYGCTVYSYRQRWFQQLDQTPAPWNEILRRFIFEVLAWVAEDESEQKSRRVKKAVVRGEVTTSYKGNKWGRPGVVLDLDRVRELSAAGMSCRGIARELGVSKTKVADVLKSLTKSLKAEQAINQLSGKRVI